MRIPPPHAAPAARYKDEGGWLARPAPQALIVLLAGAVAVAALVWATATIDQRTESRLLSLQTHQAASVLAAAIPNLQTPLVAAAAIAEASNGNALLFADAVTSDLAPAGSLSSVSLWKTENGVPHELIALGQKPVAPDHAAVFDAFIAQAHRVSGLNVLGPAEPGQPRLGYAYAAGSSDLTVYAENALPQNRRLEAAASNSAFSELNYALYLGAPGTSSVLLAASAPIPLAGHTATVTLPFGNRKLSLVAASSGPLVGSLTHWLPWIVAVGGGVLTLIAALLAERLVRRRQLAERLAEENRRLFREERGVAETLQRALLPQALPNLPGVEFAVRYVPGAEGVEIGGDWYDVIPDGERNFVLVVGDVSGRGVRAATVMATLRFTTRAYAKLGESPETVMSNLAQMISVEEEGHFATALCGAVDMDARTLTMVNAGHPAPLLLDADGSRFIATTVDPPIGAAPGDAYSQTKVELPATATLLAFSDGLVERRGEHLDVGLQRLLDAADRGPDSLEELLDHVVGELTPHGSDDDVVLMGVRWRT